MPLQFANINLKKCDLFFGECQQRTWSTSAIKLLVPSSNKQVNFKINQTKKKFPNLTNAQACGGGGTSNPYGNEIDTSFLDEFINENDFNNTNHANNSNNNNNNNNGSINIPNQNTSEQHSQKNRNNKSKFDIYLPNI